MELLNRSMFITDYVEDTVLDQGRKSDRSLLFLGHGMRPAFRGEMNTGRPTTCQERCS